MSDLHRKGTTVGLTTHYLEEAQELCSRVAILDRGSVAVIEPTRQLLARHPYRFLRIKLVGDARLPDALQSLVTAEVDGAVERSEEHTSELQSLMRISYAVFCLKKKNQQHKHAPCLRTQQDK